MNIVQSPNYRCKLLIQNLLLIKYSIPMSLTERWSTILRDVMNADRSAISVLYIYGVDETYGVNETKSFFWSNIYNLKWSICDISQSMLLMFDFGSSSTDDLITLNWSLLVPLLRGSDKKQVCTCGKFQSSSLKKGRFERTRL